MIGPALAAVGPTGDEEIVRRLAMDDEFRARLARNPMNVLSEYQIELAPTAFPDEVVIPPRRQLAEALRTMSGCQLAPARVSFPPRPKFSPALRLSSAAG